MPEQRPQYQNPEPPRTKPAKPFSERLRVPKRHLRVVKWIGQVPAIGVCTVCNRQFKVPLTAMKRVADAQESLRLQFAEHKCKGDDANPT